MGLAGRREPVLGWQPRRSNLILRSGGSARVSVVLNWAAQVPDLARGRR
jgi:hypothetical protein